MQVGAVEKNMERHPRLDVAILGNGFSGAGEPVMADIAELQEVSVMCTLS